MSARITCSLYTFYSVGWLEELCGVRMGLREKRLTMARTNIENRKVHTYLGTGLIVKPSPFFYTKYIEFSFLKIQ